MKKIIFILSLAMIVTSIVLIGFRIFGLVKSKTTNEKIKDIYSDNITSQEPDDFSFNQSNPVTDNFADPLLSEDTGVTETRSASAVTGKQYFTDLSRNSNSKLMEINDDFTGWIKVEGTSVDYPVVKHNDNIFYLKRDFYRQFNIAGTIYMDYRNLGNELDGNIVIYGHNMKNGTMFNSLNNFKKEEFFNANRTITFTNLYNTYVYEIFSVYWVSAEDYELKTNFKENDINAYYEFLREKSLFQRYIGFDEVKQIITLATCSYEVDNGRLIVHGVLNE